MYYNDHSMNFIIFKGDIKDQINFVNKFLGTNNIDTLYKDMVINDNFSLFGKEGLSIERACFSQINDDSVTIEFAVFRKHNTIAKDTISNTIKNILLNCVYYYNIDLYENILYSTKCVDGVHTDSTAHFDTNENLLLELRKESIIDENTLDVFIENIDL